MDVVPSRRDCTPQPSLGIAPGASAAPHRAGIHDRFPLGEELSPGRRPARGDGRLTRSERVQPLATRTRGPPRIVVGGAGFGGPAAAVRLAAPGHAVTPVDRRDQPGGRADVYRQDSFAFDGGPAVLTAVWLIDEGFTLVGRDRADDATLVPLDSGNRIFFPDGAAVDYSGDLGRWSGRSAGSRTTWPPSRVASSSSVAPSEALPNLYVVGAGIHPGAGLPDVLSAAKIAAALPCPTRRPGGVRPLTTVGRIGRWRSSCSGRERWARCWRRDWLPPASRSGCSVARRPTLRPSSEPG